MATLLPRFVVVSFFALLPAAVLAQSVEQGRFGRAIKVGVYYAAAEHAPVYIANPLTVELWARVNGKAEVSVLLSNEPRRSKHHWELYTEKETGRFAVSLPGYTPSVIASTIDVADDQWHHLAFVLDGGTARLFVDGKLAAEIAAKQTKPYPDTGPLLFGHQPGVPPHADTMIDEVRISRVARKFDGAPDKPYTPDADTLGLWHFDEDEAALKKLGGHADAAKVANAALPKKLADVVTDTGGFDNTVGGKTRWSDMDFGPFFSSTITPPLDKANVTHKGISIRLGKEKKHAVTFDTELLRMSAAWEGPFIKMNAGREGLAGHPEMGAKPFVTTTAFPTWRLDDHVIGADPREYKAGPIADLGRFNGLYVHGQDVVLSYCLAKPEADVLEHYSLRDDQLPVLVRTIYVGPSKKRVVLHIMDYRGAAWTEKTKSVEAISFGTADQTVGVRANLPAGFKNLDLYAPSVPFNPLGRTGTGGPTQIELHVPPRDTAVCIPIEIVRGKESDVRTFLKSEMTDAIDLTRFTKGGRPQYATTVTKGTLGKPTDGYAVDTLTAPDNNPWNSFLRFGGHDFLSNGDIAICSVSGDVWVVSGIDDKLETLKWRRFATGLFQPLGLKVIDDKIYVLGRDQITRLHDLNADGEADFYENFNNDGLVTTNGHAYVACLERGADGSLYYIKCGDRTPHGGTVLRVSPDGKKLDVVATGVRNANGLGMSPAGVLSFADNQGDWVPASRIDLVTKPLQFLGYTPMAKTPTAPTHLGHPLVWLPQNIDNSSGGQVWVEGDKWGLPAGTMLHTSYGQASLLKILPQAVKLADGTEVTQAAAWKFPLTFATGIMRGRFRPQDGQLYVSGLRGWQTAGTKDGALHRVRYTGKPMHQPSAMTVHSNGVKLSFTCELDKETAADAESWSILQWNYRWTSEYGSKFWSVADPAKQGFDTVEIKSAKLLADGKSVFLEIPELKPVMQMRIQGNIDAKDGESMKVDLYNTVHGVGEAFKE